MVWKKYNLEFIISKQKTMQKTDEKHIAREFWLRQGRQLLAIAVALFLVILMAVAYKRHDLFGEYSKNNLMAAQLVVIAAFIGFTAFNWRCPSCKKYLGKNISKHACRHCKTRLR
jgi:heme A synthase